MFLSTNDGRISAAAIRRISKPENWPHGTFHKIDYQLGAVMRTTYAAASDVRSFNRRQNHVTAKPAISKHRQ